MSKKRSKRNNKKVLRALRARRSHGGSHRGGGRGREEDRDNEPTNPTGVAPEPKITGTVTETVQPTGEDGGTVTSTQDIVTTTSTGEGGTPKSVSSKGPPRVQITPPELFDTDC